MNSLEISAHNLVKDEECYTKLLVAARYYVDNNYDPELAVFEDDGLSIDLSYLYEPPNKNYLPLS